ncbi:hypothetical protein [Jatrophihabitans fulvus]
MVGTVGLDGADDADDVGALDVLGTDELDTLAAVDGAVGPVDGSPPPSDVHATANARTRPIPTFSPIRLPPTSRILT